MWSRSRSTPTGGSEICRYTVVDDIGVVLNPLLVAGQVHGGIAQGVGQALIEDIVYDEQGQLLTGSFMDYGMPRADMFSSFDPETMNTPATNNLLGVKGAGEAGTVGAVPAVMNAVIDALAPYGVTDLPMPATPQRVWRAIQAANPEAGPDH